MATFYKALIVFEVLIGTANASLLPLTDNSAEASSAYTKRDAKYAVNGAGLSGGLHTNTADNAVWMSQIQTSTVSGQWFRVDLGRIVQLESFKLWNFNYLYPTVAMTNRGIREAEVYVSTLDELQGSDFADTSKWTRVIDRAVFSRATGLNTYGGEPSVSLRGCRGRWLALRVLSNHSTGDYVVGISELQVYQEDVPILSSTPAGVLAVESGPSAAAISWTVKTNTSAVAGFRIFRDGTAIGTCTATNFVDAGPLDIYHSYTYAVSAYDSNGVSSVASPEVVYAYRRVPFSIPWNDAETNSLSDMSVLNASPADRWVTATNGHLETSGVPIRFLGVNLTFAAAFPDHVAANALAARLAKLGVNCVRFHQIDSQMSPRGIFTNVSSSSSAYLRTFDATQMDKLDYLISQLKDHGIYADLNLHVGRWYPNYPTNGIPSCFKGIDNYMPGLIDLQREYASDLLTHVNPYTGNAYVNEPAVALVEVNNENSLIYQWLMGTFGATLHTNYMNELSAQWNTWLSTRYSNTVALSNAWSPTAGFRYDVELLTNGAFAAGAVAPWSVQSEAPAVVVSQLIAGGAPEGGYAMRFDVSSTGTVRLAQGGFALTAERAHTVTFWAKADRPRTASVSFFQNHAPTASLASASFVLEAGWQKHTLVLTPGGSDTNSRFSIEGLGSQTGTVWLAGLSSKTGNTLLGASTSYDEGAGDELLVNGDFAAGFSPWALAVYSPAAASKTVITNGAPDGSNALEINVVTNDTATWHVQYYQRDLRLTNGQPHTVSFWAKTEQPRAVTVYLMQQGGSGSGSGTGSASVTLSTNWQYHSIILTPRTNDYYTLFQITDLASKTGRVWFAKLSFRMGLSSVGLPGGESMGSVNIVANKTVSLRRTRAVQRDWMRFLWDTEYNYWTGMRDYIRNTLGAKSLLIGTQTSPSLLQAEFDVVDCHAYWQHPVFPGIPWDANNYYVKNVPMTSHTAGGTIPWSAHIRAAGKPYVCTEFNHPVPLTYTAETMPLNAAYAALQGWDGIFAFHYQENTKWSQSYFNDFFSMAHEPAKLTTYPFAAAALRRGDVSPAVGETSVRIPIDMALARIAQTDVSLGVIDLGVDSQLALCRRLSIGTGAVCSIAAPWRDTNATALVSDTAELSWGTSQRVVAVRAPLAKALIGDAGGRPFDLGNDVSVTPGDTLQRDGWCVMTLTARDGMGFQRAGSRILLTATGYTDNLHQLWSAGMGPTNATSMVVSTNWGSAPTLLEAVNARVSLGRPASSVSVWALDERGVRKAAVPVTDVGGHATFDIGSIFATVWYEISLSATRQEAPYEYWKADYFTVAELTDPAVSGEMGDPDGDGFSNFFEYAIGTNPRGAGLGGRYKAGPATDGLAEYLTVTAVRNTDATDVRFEAAVSDDLSAWTNDVTILQDTPAAFSVRDNTPVSAAPHRFLRLKVVRP